MWLKTSEFDCVNLDRCNNIYVRRAIGNGCVIKATIGNSDLYLYEDENKEKVEDIYKKIINAIFTKVEFADIKDFIGEEDV
jgi:hypothetical protein